MSRFRCLVVMAWAILLCACVAKDLPGLPPKALAASPGNSASSSQSKERADETGVDLFETYLKRSPAEDWYGLYLMDEKVGHARVWTRPSGTDEPGRLATGAESWMKVKGPAGEVQVSLVETRFYGQDPPHRLLASKFEQVTPLGRDVREAQMTNKGVTITRSDGTQPGRRYQVDKTVETIDKLAVMSPESVSELTPGQVHKFHYFDWQTERDEEISIEVASVQTIQRAGVQTRMAVLQTTYPHMGLTGLNRVIDGGVMLDSTMGPGLRLKLEDREVARSGVSGFDVVGMKVPIAAKFPALDGLESVSLRVSVDEKVHLPLGPGQQTEALGAGKWRVELSKEATGTVVSDAERAKALMVQGAIDHDVPTIKEMASSIVGAEKKPWEKARLLVGWIYGNLDKKLATHIPTASAVLKARIGDCTEHTWLFVAFCRSLGIPARPVYGLMLAGPEAGYFLYHAWAEVEIDGHWVAMDPTWKQVPADLTHLKLGSEFYELASILGAIQIEILASRSSVRP